MTVDDSGLLLIYDDPAKAERVAKRRGWQIQTIRCAATGGPVYHNWDVLSVLRDPEKFPAQCSIHPSDG